MVLVSTQSCATITKICLRTFVSPPQRSAFPISSHFPFPFYPVPGRREEVMEGGREWQREGGSEGILSSKLHVTHCSEPAFTFFLSLILFPLPHLLLLWLPSSPPALYPHTPARQLFPKKRMFQTLGNAAMLLAWFLQGASGWWIKHCRDRPWGISSMGQRRPLSWALGLLQRPQKVNTADLIIPLHFLLSQSYLGLTQGRG